MFHVNDTKKKSASGKKATGDKAKKPRSGKKVNAILFFLAGKIHAPKKTKTRYTFRLLRRQRERRQRLRQQKPRLTLLQRNKGRERKKKYIFQFYVLFVIDPPPYLLLHGTLINKGESRKLTIPYKCRVGDVRVSGLLLQKCSIHILGTR